MSPSFRQNYEEWIGSGPCTVIMPQLGTGKAQFAISNSRLAFVCELQSESEVACLLKRTYKYGKATQGFHIIRFDIATQAYQVLKHKISARTLLSTQLETKIGATSEFNEIEIPVDLDIERKHGALLSATILAVCTTDVKNDQNKLSCLSAAVEAGKQWIIKNQHPFLCMAIEGNLRTIYLAWSINGIVKIISLDLSDVGHFFTLARFHIKNKENQKTCLTIFLSDYDQSVEQEKEDLQVSDFLSEQQCKNDQQPFKFIVTRKVKLQSRQLAILYLRFPNFHWYDMGIKDDMILCEIHPNNRNMKSDSVSQKDCILPLFHSEWNGYCISPKTMQRFNEHRYQQLKSCESITCACVGFYGHLYIAAIENSETKKACLKAEKWSYELNTERVVQLQQCPQNERIKLLDDDILQEILLLDIDAQLQKLQLNAETPEKPVQIVMSMNLAEFASISQMVREIKPFENMVLTEQAITHKDRAYCTETGQVFNIVKDIKSFEGTVQYSEKIPFSDQMLIVSQSKKVLKVFVINEPSSRSSNPIGYGIFGLRHVEFLINLGSNIFLVKFKRQFFTRGQTWCLMSEREVLKTSEELEKVLEQCQEVFGKACFTVNGICKLPFRAQGQLIILELSRAGELLHSNVYKIQDLDNNHQLLDKVLINYAGDVILPVRVTSPIEDGGESVQKFEPESYEYLRRIHIQSTKSLQLAYVGLVVYYLKDEEETIHSFDISTGKSGKSLTLSDYEIKASEINNIQACSPHMIVRMSNNTSLDKETMLEHSKYLQITANNKAYIFDCTRQETRLVKSMVNLNEHNNPETYVASHFATQADDPYQKNIITNLQPNPSGTILMQNKEKANKTSAIGLFKTFSLLSILKIRVIQDTKAQGRRIDKQALFALYGQQTIFGIFKDDLRLLETVKQQMEQFGLKDQDQFGEELTQESSYSTTQIKLAAIMTMNTHESIDEDGTGNLSSILYDSLAETSLRELLSKIGRLSPAYSTFNVLRRQIDWSEIAKCNTIRSTEELEECFIQTQHTFAIKTLMWPEVDCDLITVTKKDNIITPKEIKSAIHERKGNSKSVKKNVSVRVLDMRWFFQDKQDFVDFSQILSNLPNKVYDSLFTRVILHQHWDKIQQEILKKQLLPYAIFSVLSTGYFTWMLKQDATTWQKIVFSLVISPFWSRVSYSEVEQARQMKLVGYFKKAWNVMDCLCLFLTSIVIVASFEPFQFIETDSIKTVASIASCLMIMKFFDWVRLFESTAFFALLMQQTLSDIKYFMILIFIGLLTFGVPLVILNQNRYDANLIIENPIGYRIIDAFINQYLMALGEFQSLETYVEGPQTGLCFMFFILATFTTQIVMLNMLIAIMGDTFEHIMENRVVNSTKSKLQLMSDLIAVIKKNITTDEDQYRFLFIVEPEKDEEEINFDQWEGTIKSISRIITKNAQKTNSVQEKIIKELEDSRINAEMHNLDFKKQIQQVKADVSDLEKKIVKRFDSTHEMVQAKFDSAHEVMKANHEMMKAIQKTLEQNSKVATHDNELIDF